MFLLKVECDEPTMVKVSITCERLRWMKCEVDKMCCSLSEVHEGARLWGNVAETSFSLLPRLASTW